MSDDGPLKFRAAHSAIQPLCTALETAGLRALEESKHLKKAVNEVEGRHVTGQSESLGDTSFMDVDYVRRVATSWRTLTESYCSVFQELHEITKADRAQGRGEKIGHSTIYRLYKSALAAASNARMHDPSYKSQSTRTTPSISTPCKRTAEDQDTRAAKRPRQAPSMNQQESIVIPSSKQRDSRHSRAGQPAVHGGSTVSSSTPRSHDAQALPGQGPIVDENDDVEMSDGPEHPDGDKVVGTPTALGVRYVDVTDQVERRLRMKKLRQADSRGDEKRKRLSRDSLNGDTFGQCDIGTPATKRFKHEALSRSRRELQQDTIPPSTSKREADADADQVSKHKRRRL